MKSKLAPLALALTPLLLSCGKEEAPAPAPPAQTRPAVKVATEPSTPAPPPAPASADAGDTAPPPDANTAVESFKKELLALKGFMEENENAPDPAAGLSALKELISRAKAVNAYGLPEDLGAAWTEMVEVMTALGAAVEGLNPAAPEQDPAKIAALQESMASLGERAQAASAALNEAGKKYGIESIDLGN